MKPRPLASYKTFAAFYQARHLRSGDLELDFGCWWRWSTQLNGPRYRVSLVYATGEIYVAQFGGHAKERVEVYGIGEREAVEEALTGWADQCYRPRSLFWLTERLVAAGLSHYPDRTRKSLLAA